MDAIAQEKYSVGKELSEELGDLIVSRMEVLEERIRKDIEAQVQEENQKVIKDMSEELLREYVPWIREGGGERGTSGVFDVQDDQFFASQLRSLTDDTWIPLVVNASGSDRSIQESDIKEATKKFLLGAPLMEKSPMFYNEGENIGALMSVMMACEEKFLSDPHAGNIIRSLRNYILGTGVEYSCSVQEIEEILKTFDRRNGLYNRIDTLVQNYLLYDEHYLFYYIDKGSGDVVIRDRTKPYEIQAIQTHSEDAETRLAYGRVRQNGLNLLQPQDGGYEWFADINYHDQVKMPGGESARKIGRLSEKKLVQMVKGSSGAYVRGRPMMYPALRYHKYYEDFVVDRVILNHERTKVVWIRKLMGNSTIPGGRAQKSPSGSQILTETPQIEWRVENAEINASDVTEDGRLLRMAIWCCYGTPEHVAFQDNSNQVYASIRSSETPFTETIRYHRRKIVGPIEDGFRVQIREKVKAGKLPPTSSVEIFTMEGMAALRKEIGPMIKGEASKEDIYGVIEAIIEELPTKKVTINSVDVKIDTAFPDVVRSSPLDLARELEILDRIKLLSKTELAAKYGSNYRQSAKLLSLEKGWVPPDPNASKGKVSYGAQAGNDNDNKGEKGEKG